MNYLINHRALSSVLPLQEELHFEHQHTYLFDLNHLGGLSVRGDKSAEFLQGQLSCDVREVDAHQMRPAAYCNLKGRVMALMDVIACPDLHLILPLDLMDDVKKSLDKVALFSHVTIEKARDYRVLGLYHASSAHPVNPIKALDHYKITEHLSIIFMKNDLSQDFVTPFIKNNTWRGSLAWHMLLLRAKKFELYPESRGLFLPHRLDLHLSGHIHFNKGCYKGQEIIARTHYRATLKHAMTYFTLQTDEILFSGQKIFRPGTDVEVGELIDYCPLAHDRFLMAASMLIEHPTEIHLEKHTQIKKLDM